MDSNERNIRKALSKKYYVVQEMGPLAFVISEDNSNENINETNAKKFS
jgi:hypothetical protein